jgi:hypothetical protein
VDGPWFKASRGQLARPLSETAEDLGVAPVVLSAVTSTTRKREKRKKRKFRSIEV